MMKYNNANPATRCIVREGKFCPSRIAGLLECEECKFTTADLSIPEEHLRQLYTERYFAREEYRDKRVVSMFDACAHSLNFSLRYELFACNIGLAF